MTLLVLVKKELREQVKTHKLTVVAAIFLAFGLLSPLMAKMLPQLLQNMGGDIAVQLPPPTALFAVDQYLKNFTQMGLLVVVLVAMGAIAGERERGTAAMTLCKPVSRAAFVASKFVAYAATIAVGLLLSTASCYYYVMVLFERLDPVAFFAANALLGLYLLVLLSLTLLASALFRSSLAAGGLGFGLAMILSLLGLIPAVGRYGPGALLSWGRGLLEAGGAPPAWPAFAVSVAIVLISGLLAWSAFSRKEL